MNDFVVSARKYRPQSFSALKGQEHVVQTLKNAVRTGQVSSAFLFCGLKGSGKTTSARILAKAINCAFGVATGDPCNKCERCTQAASLNIRELDAASHNSAEDMRQIVDQIRYYAPDGKKTVIIIDEVHMLSNAALNVLLKPLEDTPAHVVFILVTTEKHKILPTILSRCQVFDFHQIEVSQIVDQLLSIAKQEQIRCERDAVQLISEMAGGSLRDALSMFDLIATFSGKDEVTYREALQHLNVLDDLVYLDMILALYQGRIGEGLLIYDDVVKKGVDGLQFLNGFSKQLRNLFVLQVGTLSSLVNREAGRVAICRERAKIISNEFVYEALVLVQKCELEYRAVLNKRLHVELLLMGIGRLDLRQKNVQSPTSFATLSTERVAKKVSDSSIEGDIPIQVAVKNELGDKQGAGLLIEEKLKQKKHYVIKESTLGGESVAAEPEAVLAQKEVHRKTIKIPNAALLKDSSAPLFSGKDSPVVNGGGDQFDLETIMFHWHRCIEQLDKNKGLLGTRFLNCTLSLEGDRLVVSVADPLHKKYVMEQKGSILAYLRSKLKHEKLTLSIEAKKKNNKKMIYFDGDKLKELGERNSSVGYLKKNLDLET